MNFFPIPKRETHFMFKTLKLSIKMHMNVKQHQKTVHKPEDFTLLF
jgi:hypothetical protein